MRKLFIIGLGVGNEGLLTTRANQLIDSAEKVLNSRSMSIKDLFEELENPVGGITVVLVSGDSGFFSIAKTILNRFSSEYDIQMESGINCVQYLSAKISVHYDDAKIISLHGREGSIVPHVSYNKKLFVLTGGNQKVHDICKTLCKYRLSDVKVIVGENLSLCDERIVSGTPTSLLDEIFDDLAVMYIENTNARNPHLPFRDDDFSRGDVPMTKEEVRTISLQKLAIEQTDIVYDIGAGTGSVTIEMARKAFEGFVYAVEMNEEACELIKQNSRKLGAYNIEIQNCKAPDGLEYFPTPNKAFIGGSSGNMNEIISILTQKNPKIRIVATAITLQSLNEIMSGFEKFGLKDTEIICVNIAKSKKLGRYDMMMAQNPVYIISGQAEAK